MLKVGIVGLPNVGKSTLFKALTKKQVDCENFPFCTIEPNVGVVEVPDKRLGKLAEVSKSEKIIPAAIEFVDIAGLVRGAHKGEGLGNKFLANIREVDMIAHVVRAFGDTNVHHVDGSVDPRRDAEIIELELAMADLATVEKYMENLKNRMKAGKTKDQEKEMAALERVLTALNHGQMVNGMELDSDQLALVKPLQLLTAKPVLCVVNTAERDPLAHVPDLGDRAVLPVSVKLESELVDMDKEEQKTFLKALGLDQSGLDRLIRTSYGLLDLITFFTSGPKETRAWTVVRGTKAPQAAGKIHSDFEKGFIRAEIITCGDFLACGGESGARVKGKMRVEGKAYVIRDADVCHFRVSA